MKPFLIRPLISAHGQADFLGDKSIAHRAVLISALTPAKTLIKNFPANEDCLATIKALRQLGVKINYKAHAKNSKSLVVAVTGVGLKGFKAPKRPIFIKESGTTLRLLLGILAGQDFKVTLTAGPSLSKRPMSRVIMPLRLMGAEIKYPPITIKGCRLKAITYKMPIVSAQVKSALLLAGLYAKGKTCVIEPEKSRDHTERMLKNFGADIKVSRNSACITGKKKLKAPGRIIIPADISSAAFFIVLASILKGSKVLLKNVSLNPSRLGAVNVLKRMKADIRLLGAAPRFLTAEPAGDILVRGSCLKATVIKKEEIPFLIDEIPALMVAACFASGKSVFEGVSELRVKETDRIKSMSENLARMGAKISVKRRNNSEDIVINGPTPLRAAKLKSFGDHRTAMSLIIAGLAAKGASRIDDVDCIKKSFPNFVKVLDGLGGNS